MTKQICKACKGTGHDKASRPVVVFEQYQDSEGKDRRRHITKAQGSGCIHCQGIGYREIP